MTKKKLYEVLRAVECKSAMPLTGSKQKLITDQGIGRLLLLIHIFNNSFLTNRIYNLRK